jgi:hypothetical protein
MTVTPTEASNAGQTTIEHAETLFEGTFATALNGQALPEAIGRWRNSSAAQELFATFVKNGTVVDPTLVTGRRGIAWLENQIDPRDKYLAASGLRDPAVSWPRQSRDPTVRPSSRGESTDAGVTGGGPGRK